MGAAFNDVAVVEDQDEVGVADCAQAVSDHETGAAREQGMDQRWLSAPDCVRPRNRFWAKYT